MAQENVPIDEEHFPDPAFRDWVSRHCTPESIPTTESVVLYNDDVLISLQSIEGIEYFTNLQRIGIYDTPVCSVDLSKNRRLTSIGIDGPLTDIKISSSISYPCQINLFNCPITEESMDGLVDSIPEVEGSYFNFTSCCIDAKSMTESQVLKALSKGWRVKYTDDNGNECTRVGQMSTSDAVHFPDPFFRGWVADYFQSLRASIMTNYMLEISPVEGKDYEMIASLEGLDCFKLSHLTVHDLPLVSTVDLKQQSTLSEVQLSSLDNLQTVDFRDCVESQRFDVRLSELKRLEALDLSANTNINLVNLSNCPNLSTVLLPSELADNSRPVNIRITNLQSLDMDLLVNNLPVVPPSKNGKAKLEVYSDEADAITKEQVALARQKGWEVIAPNTTSIHDVTGTPISLLPSLTGEGQGEGAYTLGGQRIIQPKHKGIYIQRGRKLCPTIF